MLLRSATQSGPEPAAGKTAVKKGLLFDVGDLPRIRQTIAHPRFAPLWDSYVKADLAADKIFLLEELRLNNHVRHLARAWQTLERSSFVYAVNKDPGHLEIARLAIGKILEFKRWDYFLEGGKHTIALQRASETSVAISLACDWLRDALEAKMLSEMERQLGEKGAPACYMTLYGMKYPDRVRGWGFDPESDYPYRVDLSRWPFILNATNLKVIPIAGLGLSACYLLGRHPQAEQWLDMARQSARAFATMFHADGSYDEGAGYWGYTTLYYSLFLEVLYRTTGIDERNLINYPGTIRYALQMSMPTQNDPEGVVNFSDARRLGEPSSAAWVARIHRDSIAQYVAMNTGKIAHYTGMIWFDPQLPAKPPGKDLLDVRFANDIVVSRCGWGPESPLLALRSGGPANHEHADRNSLIYSAFGQRLLHDPFGAGYHNHVPQWLLRQTEAHTAILIHGKGHQYHDGKEGTNSSWAFARILFYQATDRWMVLTSDASEPYQLVQEDVKRVLRSVLFLKPDVFLILDQISMRTSPAAVQARFQVFNDDRQGKVSTTDGTFLIERPGASLQGKVFSGVPVNVRSGKLALPEDLGVYPFAEVNSGPAQEHVLLTLCTAQSGHGPHGKCSLRQDGSRWILEGKHNQTDIHLTIDTAGEIPVCKPS